MMLKEPVKLSFLSLSLSLSLPLSLFPSPSLFLSLDGASIKMFLSGHCHAENGGSWLKAELCALKGENIPKRADCEVHCGLFFPLTQRDFRADSYA